MSRSFHDLYRNHLSRSNHTFETRPVLLNSWEGLGFDINQTSLVELAGETAGLGISLFVNDDGWFGNGKYARVTDDAGLGDWVPNRQRFPNGLGPYVNQVNNFTVKNSGGDKLEFGIWVEPEMVRISWKRYPLSSSLKAVVFQKKLMAWRVVFHIHTKKPFTFLEAFANIIPNF